MNALEQELKALIISALDLEEISVNDIDTDMPLFGADGLGLDSIDALELGVALKKKYSIQLEAGDSRTREHFRSVATLAALVRAQAV